MYLVIDRGNTLLKIALFEKDEMKHLWTFAEYSAPAFNQIIANIRNSFGKLPDHGIISDVSGKDNNWFSPETGIPLLVLTHSTTLPVKLRYKTPETLGRDRIALAVGASTLYPGKDILVIGVGTTITYDFINKEKEYMGGGISPGIVMRFRALHTFTGKLPLINPVATVELIGDSTENSILSGVIIGSRNEAQGMIDAYQQLYPDLRIILTGGDMKYFDKYLKSNIFAVSNLVLVGLKDILRYNVENIR